MTRTSSPTTSVSVGRPYPLGVSLTAAGAHFSIFSRHATRVWLCFFDSPDDLKPVSEFELGREHRVGDIWCAHINGVGPGALYTYRMDGPTDIAAGHAFNSATHLLDPYAKAVIGDIPLGKGKCVVTAIHERWENNRPHTPIQQTIVYEMHVRGYTRHESATVMAPGTYKGLIEKIPYLKELGITAVELLPVQECGEGNIGREDPDTGKPLVNYWAYNSISFFAPLRRYAQDTSLTGYLDEFRSLVDAFHREGIEVYLDIVFNHTAEGGANGPALSFRGIDNSIYYLLAHHGEYVNYSGCGNTVKCGQPVVADFVIDCLRYWVSEMHVDGFRFDLATILNRDQSGFLLHMSSLVHRISEDPVLRSTKLIAEAWDVGGGYQVASFGDLRWLDWNDRYRDDVRQFWLGPVPSKNNFALRLTGSPDVYQRNARTPHHSINFVTAHDGFTMQDLVCYNEKHNDANGEDSKDGTDNNISWNCGIEGETDDPEIVALRNRLHKNFLASLFLSLGVPMLVAGDEFGRTQHGNNNAYCQDNEISWVDWRCLEEHADLHRFCKAIIAFRNQNSVFLRDIYFTGKPAVPNGEPDIAWFDTQGRPINWSSAEPHLACLISASENNGVALYMAFNPMLNPMSFKIPPGNWRVRINTARPAPNDIVDEMSAPLHKETTPLILGRKSMAVLSLAVPDAR